jgi:hypothetical protein
MAFGVLHEPAAEADKQQVSDISSNTTQHHHHDHVNFNLVDHASWNDK